MRERWLRGERELLVLAAQHAEQPAHLGQRLAAGRARRRANASRARGRVALGEPAGAARPAPTIARQRVRDDVVQLAGDPRALLGGRASAALARARARAAAAFSRSAALRRARLRSSAADEHRRDDDQHRREEEVADGVVVVGRSSDGDQPAGDAERERRASAPALEHAVPIV